MRKPLHHPTATSTALERLVMLEPKTLTCQHGRAAQGDGASLLRELARILDKEQQAEMEYGRRP